MLLVTGPVTRNMELALLKTFRATPDPKVVVAVGAVDVYIPGCPPRPQALLHGILVAIGRLREKLQS
jgi:Ni,Fe-hydrogenase III small subunit